MEDKIRIAVDAMGGEWVATMLPKRSSRVS